MKLDIQLFADGKVVIETELDDNGFSQGLTKMQKLAKTGFKAIGTAVGVVSTAMGAALANGVKFNSEIEQLQVSFEVMTGSADKAREVIQKLKKVGASTPYELKGLAKTTQLLMQYGFTADEAYEATINLGDIAQGNAEKMESIALAFGQMSSLGKVTMQDIKQMINAGFNPLQAIAEMTGETMQQVNKRYEEGKISVQEITKAMQYASSEGGKFYKSMEKQSQTLAGQLSTLKDNFDSFTGTLAQGLSNTISGEILPSINNLLTGMEEAFSKDGITGLANALGKGVAGMATAISKEAPKFVNTSFEIIQSLVKGIQDNLPEIAKAAMDTVTTFINGALDMAPDLLQLGLDMIVSVVEGLSENIDELIPKVVATMIKLFEKLSDPENIDKMTDAGVKLIIGFVKGIIKAIPEVISGGEGTIGALKNILGGGMPLIRKIGWSLIKSLAEGIWDEIKNLKTKIGNVITEIKNKFTIDGVKELIEAGKQLIAGLWEGIKQKWESLKSTVKKWGKGVTGFFKDIFGIKSPSRVFKEEIGKYLAEGMGEGFESELDNVYRNMQKAVDLNTSKMSANVQTNGTYQMAMAGTPEFNLLDNTENTTQLVVNGKVLAEIVNQENRYREVAKA